MQRTNFDFARHICVDHFSESCINYCVEWILEARINDKNREFSYVSF